jgi:hypothetical protein
VWLLGAWLLITPLVSGKPLSGTVYAQLIQLSEWAGRPATLAALSFIAYLIGVLSSATTNRVNIVSGRILKGNKILRRLLPSPGVSCGLM